ncbi:unnamed protein product [Caenorhabditis auriculariae]|uniref:Kinase n=1 Tax=Caenorhabditis auriculariae TaxID=2777116 RepID=A0A8S1HNK5_9PELO|nr:unnamed protein product [Caenorhabditis auriculariae]
MVLNIKRSSSLEGTAVDIKTTDILKPFIHQVGGHTPLSALPHGHLLKPCDEREIYFYQNMPEALREVAPRCCSTLQGSSVNLLPTCCDVCELEQVEEVVIPESMEGSPILNKRKLSKNFIVISDMTYGFRSPCVLDLKLGTRQHGDRATRAKAAIQIEKCRNTTSATLGIRLCGMQSIDLDSGELIKINKYEGRAMDESALNAAIRSFFSGSPIAALEVRRRVAEIRQVLAKSEGVRLFGASLLIVIERCPSKSQRTVARVCVVDFANATFPGYLDDNSHEGVDGGSLMGLDTLERFLSS